MDRKSFVVDLYHLVSLGHDSRIHGHRRFDLWRLCTTYGRSGMITKEKLKHHLKHLEERHAQLDKRISNDNQPEHIQTILKKEKLQLKDEIERTKDRILDL